MRQSGEQYEDRCDSSHISQLIEGADGAAVSAEATWKRNSTAALQICRGGGGSAGQGGGRGGRGEGARAWGSGQGGAGQGGAREEPARDPRVAWKKT